MTDRKIHFIYEKGKYLVDEFAKALIADIGQTSIKYAHQVVTIGGDGELIKACGRLKGHQTVMGVVPPDSPSRGFWANHGITDSDMLLDSLGAAKSYEMSPLIAEISFKIGKSKTVKSFNEFQPCDDSAQAVHMHLTVKDKLSIIGPMRIVGDGLIISTALGSTGSNRSYHGPIIDVKNPSTVLTGVGVYEPESFSPIITSPNAEFHIVFSSPEKRPIRVKYDGKLIKGTKKNPIEGMVIKRDTDNPVKVLLVQDPSIRAYAAMQPK